MIELTRGPEESSFNLKYTLCNIKGPFPTFISQSFLPLSAFLFVFQIPESLNRDKRYEKIERGSGNAIITAFSSSWSCWTLLVTFNIWRWTFSSATRNIRRVAVVLKRSKRDFGDIYHLFWIVPGVNSFGIKQIVCKMRFSFVVVCLTISLVTAIPKPNKTSRVKDEVI
jgi:hypothetical protein